MKVANISAVITGAGSGLGAAAAKALAEEGAKVSLLDTNLEGARVLAEEIGGYAVRCDVTDPVSAREALTQAAKVNDLPRVLVHCAGMTIGRVPLVGGDSLQRLSLFEKLIRVNLSGSLNMVSLVADQMVKLDPLADGERGVIVLTSSLAAFEGQKEMSAYAASKGGVASMTLPCARELGDYGIRVNTIAPGYFDTPLLKNLPQRVLDGLAKNFVYPKRLGEGREYADLMLHILSNAMLNGETIRLDAGMRLPPSF
ncbi:SDR family NAD(P)-dependent oxidoreductase [Acidihalobacter prosperus]